MWRLGAALEADGKDKEALDSYIQSYKTDRPSALRNTVIESLYTKVNGSTNGLEAKIGPNPLPVVAGSGTAKTIETPVKSSEPVAKRPKMNLSAEASAVTASLRESTVEKPVDTEIPAKLTVADKLRAGEQVTAAKQSNPKPPLVQVAEKTTEVSEPRVETIQEPEKSADVKTQIVDIAITTNKPKAEKVPTTDKTVDATNKSAEVLEKTVESTEPKAVKESTPDRPGEFKPEAAEVPAKSTETSEPLVQTAVTPNKEPNPETKIPESSAKVPETIEPNAEKASTESDPKTQVAVIQSKIEERIEPKAEDDPKSDRQVDARRLEPTTPPRAVEDIQPKVESVKIAENSEIKNNPIETSKSEDAPKDSPVAEILAATDKPAEKMENTPPAERSAEAPVKTQPTTEEPKNLFRDPLPADEPEPKTESPAEKPAVSQTNPKLGKTSVKRTSVIVSDPVGSGKKAANMKDLFEPVIISVPDGAALRSAKSEPYQNPDSSKKLDDAVSSGALRVRIVDGKDIRATAQCTLEISQERVSLINGGGSLGVLLRIEGDGDFKDVVTTSNSPKDIEVRADSGPDIDSTSRRRFYVIKSVSTAVGIFAVTFESPCGKQEILVTVR